jgi:predicted permease
MKSKGLMSWPSWCLALLALVVTTIVLFVIGEAFIEGREKSDVSAIITIVIYNLVIAVCCFFIVKQNPSSIWYVPIICNVLFIISALVEPNFWKGSDWIFVCSGWVLSIIASIIGALVGRKNIISDNP